MTTTTPRTTTHGPAGAVPELAAAGAFLERLAAQDFDRLRSTLAPAVHLRALLPPGLVELTGSAAVADRFTRWLGDTEEFDLVDSGVGEIGGRLHLRWRVHLRAARLGAGRFVVEQQAYAGVDEAARIARIDLLCTGYRRTGL